MKHKLFFLKTGYEYTHIRCQGEETKYYSEAYQVYRGVR